MSNNTYESIVAAAPTLLKPIIRILLRSGLTFKQFSKITRNLFVEVATEDYGLQGRKTNVSRVAILTGISRSEVTKIRKDLEEPQQKLETHLSNASRILTTWHTDARFLDDAGLPKDLPIESEKEISFSTLMKELSGDVPQTAMLKELKKAQTIEQTKDNKLKVLKRYYMPPNFDVSHLIRICSVIADLATTTHYNLNRDEDDLSRFEGRASNNFIDKKIVPEFQAFLEQRGQAFLEEVDEWLSEKELDKDSLTKRTPVRVGAGVYFINDDN